MNVFTALFPTQKEKEKKYLSFCFDNRVQFFFFWLRAPICWVVGNSCVKRSRPDDFLVTGH